MTAFDAAAHGRAMRAAGYWTDRSLDDLLLAAMVRFPHKEAIVAYRADSDAPLRISYAELGSRVARVAASLRALDVVRGNVVAVQLPNWWEFVVTACACARIGAAINPLMPIFRQRELDFMLPFSGASLLLLPRLWRGFDHAAMAEGLRPHLPGLRHVVVADGQGEDSFERRLLASGAGELGPERREGEGAEELALLMFTSGTTGNPKGVMHCWNSLIASTEALTVRFGLNADEVFLCCSPICHMSSFAAVMVHSLALGATTVLQDQWEPRRALAIMAAEGVTHTVGATPFLADLCDAAAAGAPRPGRLRTFLCGGAPIPPVLIERAAGELGLMVSSLWGMTETLSATLVEPERSREKSSSSDGRALAGMAVRVVDGEGRTLPPGEVGGLLVRGAHMFMGYYKRPETAVFDSDGWFVTEDLASMDDEGYIRISGRTKEMLIRGGEKVPVVEIESLLYEHPAVVAAAIVGYPDARLGERGCAFLALRPGASLDLAGVQAYMAACKVAKQYWPERVEVLEELPRTASGKIQKFVLKERAKACADAQAGAAGRAP